MGEIDFSSNPDNVLHLGSGITAGQVAVSGDLYLTDGVTGDQVKLDRALTSSYYGVQSVQFTGGGSLTRAQLFTMETTGTTGADTLYGTSGADTFDGKGAPAGSADVEIGGGGSDTYIFNQGASLDFGDAGER